MSIVYSSRTCQYDINTAHVKTLALRGWIHDNSEILNANN